MEPFNNKKGLDYAALLMVVVAISIVALHSQVTSKLHSMNRDFGDSQSALLSINPEVRFYEVYVSQAAKSAFDKTYASLDGLCIQMNNAETPERILSLQDIIQAKFNQELNPYLTQYKTRKTQEYPGYSVPIDNIVLSVDQDTLTGAAVQPTTLPMLNRRGEVIGSIFYRPTFKIEHEKNIQALITDQQTLHTLATGCSQTANPAECIASKNTQWTIVQNDNAFDLTTPEQFCYRLILPPVQA